MDISECPECGNVYDTGAYGCSECPLCRYKREIGKELYMLKERIADLEGK